MYVEFGHKTEYSWTLIACCARQAPAASPTLTEDAGMLKSVMPISVDVYPNVGFLFDCEMLRSEILEEKALKTVQNQWKSQNVDMVSTHLQKFWQKCVCAFKGVQ